MLLHALLELGHSPENVMRDPAPGFDQPALARTRKKPGSPREKPRSTPGPLPGAHRLEPRGALCRRNVLGVWPHPALLVQPTALSGSPRRSVSSVVFEYLRYLRSSFRVVSESMRIVSLKGIKATNIIRSRTDWWRATLGWLHYAKNERVQISLST